MIENYGGGVCEFFCRLYFHLDFFLSKNLVVDYLRKDLTFVVLNEETLLVTLRTQALFFPCSFFPLVHPSILSSYPLLLKTSMQVDQ